LAKDLSVSAGEWDYGNALENYPFEEQNVRKIVIHPLFDLKRGANNLPLTQTFLNSSLGFLTSC